MAMVITYEEIAFPFASHSNLNFVFHAIEFHVRIGRHSARQLKYFHITASGDAGGTFLRTE